VSIGDSLTKGDPDMTRVAILSGIATVIVVSAAALLMPNMASTQQLPPPRNPLAASPTYTPAGVGGNAGSAWFIATTSNNEHYPVLCEKTGNGIQCYSGKF
jgi:hypothetical protein